MAKSTTHRHSCAYFVCPAARKRPPHRFVGHGFSRAVKTTESGFSRCVFEINLQPRSLPHIESGMNKTEPVSIRVVRPDEFSWGTSQTPGSLRLAAIAPELGVGSALWAGTFLVEPGAATGIHHHGPQETVAYVLEGESFIQWGERGEHSMTARAGDFLHVPAWLVHREINRSKDAPFRWVVIRSTSEPIVVNLPDSTWD